MCEGIIGCFQLTESDNFEEYLEALEIPVPMRKMMAFAKPKVNISNDGDNWTVGYKIAHRVMMMSFTIGEEFDDMKPFSEEVSKVTATINEEENNLELKEVNSKGTFVTTFSPTDDGMRVDLMAVDQNIAASRIFEKIDE